MEGGEDQGIAVAEMTGGMGILIGGAGMMVAKEHGQGGRAPPLAHDAGGRVPPRAYNTLMTTMRTQHLQALLVVPCGRSGMRRGARLARPPGERRLMMT